jgi:hypothetical protein
MEGLEVDFSKPNNIGMDVMQEEHVMDARGEVFYFDD